MRITERGKSVFATEVIEPETIFPYGGLEIFMKQYLETSDTQWMVNGKRLDDDIPDSEFYTWLDANPKYYPSSAPLNAWIGSLVNQPNLGETDNCRIIDFDFTEKASKLIPAYPFVSKWPKTFICIETIARVEPGDQLLCLYGWDEEHIAKYITVRKSVRDYVRYYESKSENGKAGQKKQKKKREIMLTKLAILREKKKKMRDEM